MSVSKQQTSPAEDVTARVGVVRVALVSGQVANQWRGQPGREGVASLNHDP
jgi:hypothetical protein